MKRPLRIVLVLLFAATFARGLAYGAALPAWQGPDEPSHYAYTERLATGTFPPLESYATVPSPALDASVTQTLTSYRERQLDRPLTPTARRLLLPPEKPGLSTAGAGAFAARTYPPLYYLTLLPAYWLGGDTATERLYAIRATSAVYGALFACAIVLLVFELTRARRLATAAGVLASLPPMVMQASGTCTPDIALTCFAAVACWALVRLRRRSDARAIAFAGAALLAAALTKPVGLYVAAIVLASVGWPWLIETLRRLRRIWLVAAAAIMAGGLYFAGTRGVTVTAATSHGVLPTIRFALSYLWQYYLPRLWFMKPAFGDQSVLTDPLPLWGTWVRTGAGSFGWLSAWMPHWAYLVAVGGTLWTCIGGACAIVRRRSTELDAIALRAFAGFLVLVLVLHVPEIFSLLNNSGLVLQGRYALPAIPLLALAFTAPLAQLRYPARTAFLAGSLTCWTIVSLAGFSTLIAFFST